MGITVRTFRDTAGSNRTGVVLDGSRYGCVPEAMESEAAAEAMKYDGVRRETLVILAELMHTWRRSSSSPSTARSSW